MSNKYRESIKNTVAMAECPENFSLSKPSKISAKTKCSFSIPAGPDFSCIGATEACVDCYAQKGRHHFSSVQNALARNWKLFEKYEESGDYITPAKMILKIFSKNIKIFRLYESGDFHSDWAVKLWAYVIKNRKNIKFWAYTRSFNLDFGPLMKQKNFMLWASTDIYNQEAAEKFVKRWKKHKVKFAFGPWGSNKIPDNSFVCPVTSKKMDVRGACEKCKLCIDREITEKNIVFLKH